MEKSDKIKILRGYLGAYNKAPSDSVKSALRSYDSLTNLIVKAPIKLHNEVITFLLIKDGRKHYSVHTSFELIETYVSKNEEYMSLVDIRSQLAFVKITTDEMPNIRQWDIPRQLILFRQGCGLPTIILTDHHNPPEQSFTNLGFKIVDLYKGVLNQDEEEF